LSKSESIRLGVDTLQHNHRGIEQRIAAARREILFQQRRLTSLASANSAPESSVVASATVDQRLDSLYVALEDELRGSREDIKGRLAPYVDRVSLAGAGQPHAPILDVGCGRGEWLELLREEHLAAYGIDSNTVMIDRSTSLGLDARHADLLAHLEGLQDGALGGLTAFHVVEHLPFGILVDFLDQALRVLQPGGILILETPNPEAMRVGATTFYNDPTHRNPIPPVLLRFLVKNRGFTEVEILLLHPFSHADRLHDPGRDTAHLNVLIFGHQDYAVIARRDQA
jgi:O-antigen chain-terminating methyltransferase